MRLHGHVVIAAKGMERRQLTALLRGRGLRSFPFPLNLSLLCPFPPNLSFIQPNLTRGCVLKVLELSSDVSVVFGRSSS